jgi:2-methylisocitrate lyase-like PEP mutase family enzyme
MKKTERLRELLGKPGIIMAPGAYDAFSAKLIEAAGFEAVYMTVRYRGFYSGLPRYWTAHFDGYGIQCQTDRRYGFDSPYCRC